jgi:hypothetical protein
VGVSLTEKRRFIAAHTPTEQTGLRARVHNPVYVAATVMCPWIYDNTKKGKKGSVTTEKHYQKAADANYNQLSPTPF